MNVSLLCSSTSGGQKLAVLLGLLSLICFSAPGQSVGRAADGDQPETSRWSETIKLLANIQVNQVVDGKRVALKLIEQPVFSFTDTVDQNDEGTIWLWGRTGRPSAVMQLWTDMPRKAWRYYAFTSLSSGRVEAIGTGQVRYAIRWVPQEAGVQFKRFPNPPKPAAKEVSRLRQMKALGRRFKAHEILNQRSELRLLPRQVHRYSDRKSGLIDGAAFLWARGSDPEMLMLIELVESDADAAHWRCPTSPGSPSTSFRKKADANRTAALPRAKTPKPTVTGLL